MRIINAKLVTPGSEKLHSIMISQEHISKISQQDSLIQPQSEDFDACGDFLLPAMTDIHVHTRDPGFTNKEDWQTFAASCLKGGVTAACDMPNTIPNTMDQESIEVKRQKAAGIPIHHKFYLGVGAGNIDKVGELLENNRDILCGLKVYYGQSTGELMYSDLEKLGDSLPNPMVGLLTFHSEDQCHIDKNQESFGIEKCETKESFRVHSEVRSSKAAYASTKTIIDWGAKRQVPIHIAHLSTPDEVDLIEEAKKRGQKITSEVAPHHLIFSTDDYKDLGSLIKMNPPVRSSEELKKMRECFGGHLIEVFATDHAPHTLEEKSNQNYSQCPSGVPAVEFFTPLLLTLADELGISLEDAVKMGADTPAAMAGFKKRGKILPGYLADLIIVKRHKHIIKDNHIQAKCNWSPYKGLELGYAVRATIYKGNKVFEQELN